MTHSSSVEGPAISLLHVLLGGVHGLGVDVDRDGGVGREVLVPDGLYLVVHVLLGQALELLHRCQEPVNHSRS